MKKKYIITSAILVVCLTTLVLLLNYRRIDIPGFGNIRVFFGRTSDETVNSLKEHAEKLMLEGDYDGAREAGESIARYGGDKKVLGFLIIAESQWCAGAVNKSIESLIDAIEHGATEDTESRALLSNFAFNRIEEIMNSKPYKIYIIAVLLNVLKECDASSYEKEKENFNRMLSEKMAIKVSFVHTRDKKYITREDALKDVKAEAVFEAKKKAPSLLLNEIKKIFNLEGLITDGDILNYIRDKAVYDVLKAEVKRVSMGEETLPDDIIMEEREELGEGSFLSEDIDTGYQGEATCIARIPDFSIMDLLNYCGVNIFTVASIENLMTK
ncbi:MAG: hypothetical protein B6D57_02370 [Candidatus Coatesbacteria bacterium 4484_99]|uniref:Uncharacterized protein n=1 Tax=Candidatus Coatesbacteria bacterium 4484_99 TaxID=1970774 RepID=A0A1W9S1H3_9BACT|nr:MAG: hypothetical protein B6D57_02370 [Candidatus Coatesbacteria bacterium 4484_99]RLC42733.1 MAG: hypothetical protein DRH49_03315 [Candidatus Coatesbacteria bacterium]